MGISKAAIPEAAAPPSHACNSYSLDMYFNAPDGDSQKVEKVTAVNSNPSRASRLKCVGTTGAEGTLERSVKRKRENLREKFAEVSGEMTYESKGKLNSVLGKRRERKFDSDCCGNELEDCAVVIGWKGWCAFEREEYDDPAEALINRRQQRWKTKMVAQLPQEEMPFVEASINKGLNSQYPSEICYRDNLNQTELSNKHVNAAAHVEELNPVTTPTTDSIQPTKSCQVSDAVFSSSSSTQCRSNSAAFKEYNDIEGRAFISERSDGLKHDRLKMIVQDPNTNSERGEGSVSITSINKVIDVIHIAEDLHEACQVSELKGMTNVCNNISVIQVNETEEDENAAKAEYPEQKLSAKGESCDRRYCKNASAINGKQGPLSNEIEDSNYLEEGVADGVPVRLISGRTKKSRTTHMRKSVYRKSRGSSKKNETVEDPAPGQSVSCPICCKRLTGDIQNRDFNTEFNRHIDSCMQS